MISDKKLQALIGWDPHEGQKKVIDCKSRDIAICAGRRWGKSQVCAYIALKTFLQGIADIKAGRRKEMKIWVVAPTYELANKVFDYIVSWYIKVPGSEQAAVSTRTPAQIRLAVNVWIQCKSADAPEGMLGEGLDLVIMDEAAMTSRNVYERYVYPTLTSKKGKTIFISTPFGQNWFYHKCTELKGEGAYFHFQTKNSPYFSEEEWDRAKKMMPQQVFEQEYEASFLPDAAAVFRRVDEIIKDNSLADVAREHRYVMGVDLAKHEDFTAITVIDKYNNNVVYFDRFREIDYPFQKARIKATAERYNGARIYIDSTGVGEPIFEDLRREKLFIDDFKFSNKSKKELVEKLSIFIEQKKVFIPNNETLIDEIKSFGYKLTDSGNVIYSAPEGLHDDCVFSLALAVWGLTGTAKPMTIIQEAIAKAESNKIQENYI
jgi:hypothetical protein